jgi:Uma2 family endonuclease
MAIALLKRFTLSEYHRLVDLGFFQEDDRVELIRGQIIQMAAKGTAHEVCLTRLLRELPKLLLEQALLRCQSPITLVDDSEPEPDFSIVHNREDDYLSAHPSAADALLVIEVSDSLLSYDQETKLSLYAESEISDYWIFNLPENCLEAYSEPYQKQTGEFGYRVKRIVLAGEAIALPHFPHQPLSLAKIFPGQPGQINC